MIVNPDTVISAIADLETQKQQAIEVLLKQKEDLIAEIDTKLSLLGFNPEQKRGRKPKSTSST